MVACEVMETKMAYKPNQKDDDGNPLPLGSIQIRLGSHQSNLGQVRNVYARPAVWQRRIPLIGEIVLVMTGPANDWSTSGAKNTGFYYFSPLNSTDDLTFHVFPKLFKRSNNIGGGDPADRNYDKEKWGYTFPNVPKRMFPLQPFDGDDLFEGRTGQSIRFGTTVLGDLSVYAEKPTWKGTVKNDPITILRVVRTTAGNSPSPTSTQIQQSTNKYVVEDIEKDDSSIYLTTSQTIPNLKGGFNKNLDVKKLAMFKTTPQIVLNSGRVVLNATKDDIYLIGKEQAVVTGKKVILQSDKYKVDLDVLIDYIKSHVDYFADFCTGQSFASSPAGPTGPTVHAAQTTKLKTVDFQKFKIP